MSKQSTYGPNNPHPLSQMRTELVWEGKYDEFGNRRDVDIASCAMPMQRIETVDEPRQRAAAEGQTDMFAMILSHASRTSMRAGGRISTIDISEVAEAQRLTEKREKSFSTLRY